MAREGGGGGLIAQLRRIADAVEVLPEVRDHLNENVDGLHDHFDGMRGEIRGLDGHLGEVRKLLHPRQALGGLGRIGERIRGG